MLGAGKTEFLGLTEADFNAYEEKKWSSNRFNLERMRTREKVVSLLEDAHNAVDAKPPGLELRSTHDHPTVFNGKKVQAQWCFACRPLEERKALALSLSRERSLGDEVEDPAVHHRHAFTGVKIDLVGLELLLGLHQHASIDGKNVLAKLEDPEHQKEFETLLAALSDDVCLQAGETTLSASEMKADTFVEKLRLVVEEKKEEWLLLVQRFPRDRAELASAEAIGLLKEPFQALLNFYEFIAWSPSNDHLNLSETLKKQAVEREKAQRAAEEARERAREEAEKRKEEARRKEESRRESFRDRGQRPRSNPNQPRESSSRPEGHNERPQRGGPGGNDRGPKRGERPDGRGQGRGRQDGRGQGGGRPDGRGQGRGRQDGRGQGGGRRDQRGKGRGPQQDRRRQNEQAAKEAALKRVEGPIEVGVPVEVATGMFSGRRGTVLEMNTKGELKVLVGPLPVRLDVSDVHRLG